MRERDVLAEIRAIRDELACRYGGGAGMLSQALAERSRLAGRVVVRFAPRSPQPRVPWVPHSIWASPHRVDLCRRPNTAAASGGVGGCGWGASGRRKAIMPRIPQCDGEIKKPTSAAR